MRLLALPITLSFFAFALSLGSPSSAQPSNGPHWILGPTEPSFKKIEFELLERPSRAPSRSLASALALHPNLPPADIIAALANPGSPSRAKGSFTLAPAGSEPCAVHIALDSLGHGGIARDLYAAAQAAGGDIDPSLLDRMNELEALHELGHCAAASSPERFRHPSLSSEQNRAISELLLISPGLGSLHSEMFADAFAAITRIRDAKAPGARAGALRETMILKDWRANSTNASQSDRHPDGQSGHPRPAIFGNDHASAPALAEILWDLPRYLAMESAQAASEASSRALLRVAMQAIDGQAESDKLFDPAKLAFDAVSDSMQELWSRQRDILLSRGPKAKERSARDAPIYAKASLEASGPAGRALATLADAIGEASIARAPAWLLLGDENLLRPLQYGPLAIEAANEAAKMALSSLPDPAELFARFGADSSTFSNAKLGWENAMADERERLGARAISPAWDPEAAIKLFKDLFPKGIPAPKKRGSSLDFFEIPTLTRQQTPEARGASL